MRVNAEHWKMMIESRSKSNFALVMCNHASRIDWLLALWCGYCDSFVRVGFVTEGPMQFLPIVGWFRKLCEDIFVWRSFKVDKPRIDANITSFKRTHTTRQLFLAIEGAIVDKGEFDRQYIEECRSFCEAQGYAPFEYVLTPRYKGVHALAQHAGDELYAVTNVFVQDGKLLNCKLDDPARVVPDLYYLLANPMTVTAYFERIQIGADQERAKRACMDNYKHRDELIAHFHEHGEYPGGLTYQTLPLEIGRRVASVALQLALMAAGLAPFGKAYMLPRIFAYLVLTLGACHTLGELLSGESRESIPFETIFKSYLYAGRDAKVIAKSKGKSPLKSAATSGEALSETAKMFNLMTKFPAN